MKMKKLLNATAEGLCPTIRAGYFKAGGACLMSRTGYAQPFVMGSTYLPDGVAPTISTMQGGNRQPGVLLPCASRGRGREQRLETKEDETFYALTTVQKDSMLMMKGTDLVGSQDFRVRKLTPRECFRLMGVEDSDIDKIKASGVSKSQQYKMAGNSIVVDVLYHIFRQAFTDDLDEERQMIIKALWKGCISLTSAEHGGLRN